MVALTRLLLPTVAGVAAAASLSIPAHAQDSGDAWDTGPGTAVHAVADPGAGNRPNGVDTGVVSLVGNGVVVKLLEANGDASDYIYSFGAPGAARDIWFLSDNNEGNTLLPAQLNGIPLTTFDIVENGTFQSMTHTDPQGVTSDIFGTTFRVMSDKDPVPEPGVWAMLILGFGAAGAVLRHRWSKLAV